MEADEKTRHEAIMVFIYGPNPKIYGLDFLQVRPVYKVYAQRTRARPSTLSVSHVRPTYYFNPKNSFLPLPKQGPKVT